jgi:hypothetical protein
VLSAVDQAASAIRVCVVIRLRARHDAHSTRQSRFVERVIGDAYDKRRRLRVLFFRAPHRDQLTRQRVI